VLIVAVTHSLLARNLPQLIWKIHEKADPGAAVLSLLSGTAVAQSTVTLCGLVDAGYNR
jgi:hypothetical protein